MPWAARRLGRDVKWTEDRREHFISSAHERGQLQEVHGRLRRRGPPARPRREVLARQRRLHALRHHRADHHLHPAARALQAGRLPGRVLVAVHQHRDRDARTGAPGARRACFAMERTMDAIAAHLGLDRPRCARRNFIQPDEMPYDHGLMFQDGRPLKYDSGDFPASLDKLKALVGWDDFAAYRAQARARGAPGRDRHRLLRRGHRRRPVRGRRTSRSRPAGRVNVATGLTTQGQGHQTIFAQIVADELGVPIEDVHVTTGDTRRMAVRRGHVRLARRGDVGQRGGAGGPGGARQGAADRRRRAGGVDPTTSRSSTASCSVKGAPRHVDRPLGTLRCCRTRCATRSTSRPRRQPSSPAPFDPDKPPVADDDEPGLEGRDFYSPTQATFANGMHAAIVETDPVTAEIRILRYCVVHDCGRHGQPDDRRGPGARRGGPGRRRCAVRADGLRRVRPAAQRVVHGLPRCPTPPRSHTSRSTTSRRRRPLNPFGVKGAGEAGMHPGVRGHRLRHRGRRGVPHHARCRSRPNELWDLRHRQQPGRSRPSTAPRVPPQEGAR